MYQERQCSSQLKLARIEITKWLMMLEYLSMSSELHSVIPMPRMLLLVHKMILCTDHTSY